LRVVVKEALLYVDGELIEGGIVASDGVIEAVVKDPSKYIQVADVVINASRRLTIPGGIDLHAHIYDPEYLHHEDWRSGSIAAAFGGVTTVFDMPLRLFVDSVEKLKIKVEAGLRDSFVNFGVHAGMIRDENYESINELYSSGVIGYKIYMAGEWRPSDRALIEILERVSSIDGVAIVHAEDDQLISYGLRRTSGRRDALAYHESRSDVAEASSIAKAGFYSMETGAHVHIAHLSSKLGSLTVESLWSMGAMITAETCPHYLFFTRDDVKKYGNYIKVSPSLKTPEDVEWLWMSLSRGVIDAVASDHAPSTVEEKEVQDPWSAWGGMPVIETMIPFIYTYGVKMGRIDYGKFIEVTSINPARIARLYPRKGALTPGSDADIVVLDVEKERVVKAGELHYKVGWSPFEGLRLTGWPCHVVVSGKPVVIDGELVGEPGSGSFVGSRTFS